MIDRLAAYVIGVYREGRAILRDVSISIVPGEMVAILGANGAGKSTLLSVLSGELAPTSGHVSLMGRPLSNWHRLEAMAKTEIGHLAGRNHMRLSTGERQRVELARAIAQLGPPSHEHPAWLLLDEPTANLDLAHALMMLERLQAMSRRGYGVAMVVHDLGLALRFADRIVLLRRGQVLASGPPELLVEYPELLREGFGVDATVITHPQRGWPIVLPIAAHVSERSRTP